MPETSIETRIQDEQSHSETSVSDKNHKTVNICSVSIILLVILILLVIPFAIRFSSKFTPYLLLFHVCEKATTEQEVFYIINEIQGIKATEIREKYFFPYFKY